LLKSFEHENDHLLDVLRGGHVSDKLVCCGSDCLTSGVTHGDLGVEGTIAGIALRYDGAQGLVSVVDLIDALLYFSNR